MDKDVASRAIEILEDALAEIAEWYNPEGMGTANALAEIASDALDDLAKLRARDTDGSPEGPDPQGLDGEAATAGAAESGIAQTSPGDPT
jgi:hypothetical protein